MPTVTQQTVQGYAHCEDSLCEGNTQQPVELVKVTTQFSYRELGGDANGFEKSMEHYVFADEGEVECSACGKRRALAVQERPVYPASQWAQDGLLKLIRDGKVKTAGQADDGELAALREQLVAQQAQIAKLLEAQVEPKRGPGRPRKTEGDAA